MTVNDDSGREVSDWLHEFGAHRVPDHLDAVLRTTSTRPPAPGLVEPRKVAPHGSGLPRGHARAAPARPGPAHRSPGPRGRRGLHPGHRSPPARVPAPFGPARNGEIVSSADGDIYLVDPATHGSSPADRRPDFDFGPVFSRDGTRFSFLRGGPTDCGQPDCGLILVVANADGTGVREITPGVPMLDGLDWSPDGSQLAILTAAEDGQGHGLAIVNADGSGMRTLDLARPVHLPSWLPPDGGEIVFRGEQLSDDAPPPGIFAVRPDGSGLREISTRPRGRRQRLRGHQRIAGRHPHRLSGRRRSGRPVPVPCAGPANRSRPRAPVPGRCRPVRTASSHRTASRCCICGGLRATACSSSWRRPTEAPPARRSVPRRPWAPTDPRSTATCFSPDGTAVIANFDVEKQARLLPIDGSPASDLAPWRAGLPGLPAPRTLRLRAAAHLGTSPRPASRTLARRRGPRPRRRLPRR